ncbi:MAG: gephyrin-like molybdotransferase Glp [Chthonomonadales bacterium]
MLSVRDALHALLHQVRALPGERVPLLQALGRVLAQDVAADIDNPPFDNSAMDGYAVIAADVAAASPSNPVLLEALGDVLAGEGPGPALRSGACVRIMTGAPIPPGADAVVPIEDVRVTGSRVQVLAPAKQGMHVRRRGEDYTSGVRLVQAGTVIGPPEIAALAAAGCPEPLCTRRPKVALIATGDEIVDPAIRPDPGQIRDTNTFSLAAASLDAGAEILSIARVPDLEEQVEEALRSAAGMEGGAPADVIISSGGVSVGDRDFVKPVLERIGHLQLWRVAMKPGKPIAVGQIGTSLFFGLPGNPVSAMVTFEVFVRPVLWKLSGRSQLERPRVSARLTQAIRHAPGREEYVRVRVTWSDGSFWAEPTGPQGSGMIRSLLGANAFVVLPADAGDQPEGADVCAMLLSLPQAGGVLHGEGQAP